MTARWAVVSTLGVTQTLSWASSYYLPAILADPIAKELGLSREWVFGIFSASLLLSGLLGPWAGRMIDRHGGRGVLCWTNLAFAAGLALLASSYNLFTLSLAWTVIGIAMGFGLYEAAFATVTRLYGADARNAITGITLFAGFASTVGWPASTWMLSTFGWRGACLGWVAVHLLVALPLNGLLVPRLPKAETPPPTPGQVQGGIPWTMVILAGVFGVTWFVSAGMAAHLPHLLQAFGASSTEAIAAASLVGPAQVGARLIEFGLLRRLSPLLSARIAMSLHPVGVVLLLLFGPVAAIPFALLHGGGNGMLTIARGTLPLVLFGAAGYGLRAGLLAAPARILQGGAPVLFSFVLDRGGSIGVVLLSGGLMAASCLTLVLLRTPARQQP